MSFKNKKKKDLRCRLKKNETYERLPGTIDGSMFSIEKCEDSTIYLYDHLSQVFVDDCKRCKVFIGPCDSSIFVRDCEDMEIYSISKQFRVSDTKRIKCHIYSESDPALENVELMQVAPYNFQFPGLRRHFECAKLDINRNHWSQVFDFTPKFSANNWTIMDPKDYPGQIIRKLDDNDEVIENIIQIPKAFGGNSDAPIIKGSQDNQESGLEAFDIKTTKQEAQKILEKKEDEQLNKQLITKDTQNDVTNINDISLGSLNTNQQTQSQVEAQELKQRKFQNEKEIDVDQKKEEKQEIKNDEKKDKEKSQAGFSKLVAVGGIALAVIVVLFVSLK